MDTTTITLHYGKPRCPLCGNTVGDDGRCLRDATCQREARELADFKETQRIEKKAATVRPAPRDRADASDTHTKIGNGHGGFEHLSNETACRLPSRGRRVDMNVEKVTCPKCVEVCLTMFGQP